MSKSLPFFSLIIMICLSGILNAQGTGSNLADTSRKVKVDSTKVHMEIESEFPGGSAGWRQFLMEHLKYPSKAVKNKIEGTVVLQFIVQKDGTVTDIEAISGPDLLRESAIDVLKQSPRWKPAIQDGRVVKSYKKQPITYRLEPK